MSLPGWNTDNILDLTISCSNVGEDLIDFPVLITLSSGSGQNSYDATYVFDELNYPSVDDDFTGSDDDPVNTDLWSGSGIISNNMAKPNSSFSSEYRLTGDFDIEVYWDKTTGTWATSDNLRFTVSSSSNSFFIYREYNNQRITGSNGTTYNYSTYDWDTGYFRFLKVGTNIKLYFKRYGGDSWIQRSSFSCVNEDYKVTISKTSTCTPSFDNFKINSGTVIWPQGTHPNRKKIAVTTTISGVETELYVEIERWDYTTVSGNEQAWLWTKVPTIASGTDTSLYLYYDSNHTTNSGHIGDTGETPAQNVWDADFVMVHHMSIDPSSTMTDSTSNGHNLTLYNMDSGNLTDGPIAKTMSFNGTNEYMQTADHADFDIDTFTVETILNIPSAGSINTIHHHGDFVVGGSQGIKSQVNATGKVGLQYYSGSWRAPTSTGSITYNQNTYIVTAVDASYLNVYFDGALETPIALPAALTDTAYPMYIGTCKSSSLIDYMTTMVEELRYSKITRSDAWVKATYYSNWDDFITFGEGPPTYYFSGHVYELGNTISGAQLFMYRRDTGAYLGATTSSGDGGFHVITSYSGSHFLVCLDPVGGQSYNDLVYGEMYPATVSG